MIKNITLGLGTLAIAIVPIATTISCKSKYPLYATPGTLRKNDKLRVTLDFKKVKTVEEVNKEWKKLTDKLATRKDKSDIILLIVKYKKLQDGEKISAKNIFKFHDKQWDKYPGLKERVDKVKKAILAALPKK